MKDRAMQALYLLGLDPIAETTGDLHSYGFRTQRSCADALQRCFQLLSHRSNAGWVLEGDICSCFDRISHDWLLAHIPMNQAILRKWLQAGFLEKNVLSATTEGTPQGGIISPALANLTLDGLEGRLAKYFAHSRRQRHQAKVHLVRYADDFVITGTSHELLATAVKPVVQDFLRERGLELSAAKTSITPVEDGFDFLGQTVRRHGRKLLLRPSRKSVRTVLSRARALIRSSGHLTAGQLIRRLNPLLRGWTSYHRHACSSTTFFQVDRAISQSLWRWARRRHRQKTAAWLGKTYFPVVCGGATAFRGEVSGRDGRRKTVFLLRPTQVPIQRHVPLRTGANPYDPAWEEYFEARLQRRVQSSLTGPSRLHSLWQEQHGRCPVCQQPLSPDRGWHLHHREWLVYGGGDDWDNLVLLHPNCHRQVHTLGLQVDKAASREGRS